MHALKPIAQKKFFNAKVPRLDYVGFQLILADFEIFEIHSAKVI